MVPPRSVRGGGEAAATEPVRPALVDPRWRDGNACTTSRLRRIFGGAYTGREWQGQVSKLEGDRGRKTLEFPGMRRNVLS